MHHELSPAMTEALGRRHREDVERIKALYVERRARHDLIHFERPNDRMLPVCVTAVVMFIVVVALGALLKGLG